MRSRLPGLAAWILLCSCTADPSVVCVGSVNGLDCGQDAPSGPSTISCGNGKLDVGEQCDTAARGALACPAACDDGNACTSDRLLSAGTCGAVCQSDSILACATGDGCCPAGCNSVADADCTPSCGDGVLDDGEVCDTGIPAGSTGACPTACDDGNACTTDDLNGEGTCWPACGTTPIAACADSDGCCPSGCAFAVDLDCPKPDEVCNGVDDNRDLAIDEGCDDDADGFCDQGMVTVGSPAICTQGGGDCDDTKESMFPGSPETCDAVDQDCDGLTDEEIPGVGAPCEAAVGGCGGVTSCMAGVLTCRGGFVSPSGVAGAAGTRAAPLASIAEAIASASIAGVDVCVCAPATFEGSTYQESLTMVEGVSVIGNYDCDTWDRHGSGPHTRIRNTRTDGVRFPAGLTRATALDGFEVEPLLTEGGTSLAVRVTNSSPSLIDVEVEWPSFAPTPRSGIGLQIVASGGVAGSPLVVGGEFGGPGLATSASIGLDCQGCAGATLSSRFSSGVAPLSVGIHVRGAVDGLTITASDAWFWDIDGPWGGANTTGLWLDGCTGSPEIGAGTGLRIRGGVDTGMGFGIRATGPACAPRIVGDGVDGNGSILGCGFEFGAGSCIGVSCEQGAPCEIRDIVATGAQFLLGTTAGTMDTAGGVQCLDGGCTILEGGDFRVGDAVVTLSSAGLDIDGSSPLVDANAMRGSDGGSCAPGGCAAVRIGRSSARLINNVIRQGLATGVAVDILGDATGPDLHSNAILPTCRSGGSGVGIRIHEGGSFGPLPTIRNNVVTPQPGSCANVNGVQEAGPLADPVVFDNNDLWALPGGLYVNEGSGGLSTQGQVNALPESDGNLVCDPILDIDGHIGGASCCVDAGVSTGAPESDRDGQPRPVGAGFDIGPDEVAGP